MLAGEKFKLIQDSSKHLSLARYNSLDDTYLAGSRVTKPHFYILPTYSTALKSGLEGGYVFPTKYGAFIPAASINEPFGTLGRLNYRKQLSETLDRKHQTGINIGIYQWKNISYDQNIYGSIVNSEVEEEGIGARLGYGGTYQFTRKYNFMYQVVGSSSNKLRSSATSLIGYNIGNTSMLQYGLLNNYTVVAWKVKQIYIMYNFSAKAISANISTGFRF